VPLAASRANDVSCLSCPPAAPSLHSIRPLSSLESARARASVRASSRPGYANPETLISPRAPARHLNPPRAGPDDLRPSPLVFFTGPVNYVGGKRSRHYARSLIVTGSYIPENRFLVPAFDGYVETRTSSSRKIWTRTFAKEEILLPDRRSEARPTSRDDLSSLSLSLSSESIGRSSVR